MSRMRAKARGVPQLRSASAGSQGLVQLSSPTRIQRAGRSVTLKATGIGSWMDAEVLCYFNRRKPAFVFNAEKRRYGQALAKWRRKGVGAAPTPPSRNFWKSCKIQELSSGRLRCLCSGPRSPGLGRRRIEIPKPTRTPAHLDPQRTPLYQLNPNDCFVALHPSMAWTLFRRRRGPKRGPNYDQVEVRTGKKAILADWVETRNTRAWVELSPCAAQGLFNQPGVHNRSVVVSTPKAGSSASCPACNFREILKERRSGMQVRIRVGRFVVPFSGFPCGFSRRR